MEVQVTGTYLITIILSSTMLASVLGATIGIFGQVWLEKIRNKAKKEERKEDKVEKKEDELTITIASIIESIDNIVRGLRGLYYDKILYLSNRYSEEGNITSKELYDLDDLHGIYKKCLNGDGLLDKEMDKVHKLPRVKSKPCSREKMEQLLREIMGVKKKVGEESDV